MSNPMDSDSRRKPGDLRNTPEFLPCRIGLTINLGDPLAILMCRKPWVQIKAALVQKLAHVAHPD